ncbi:MAG: hypothetical protein GPJ54_04720 [Candidatus Heimdallarchaeota archaeon]|nr:hypothetical protein [Candidatus Heimdallarchaeota archaeon]
MKRSIILIFFVLLSPLYLSTSNADTVLGDTYTNPVDITTGDTNGTLPGPAPDGSIWYSVNLTGSYTFSLDGPVMTDFDFIIYTISTETGNLTSLRTANDTTYPDNVVITEIPSITFLINVYDVYDDGGDFVLTISEFYVNTEPVSPPLPVIPDGYEQISLEWGFNMYKFSGMNGKTLSLDLKMLQSEFNIAIVDTDFYPSVLWAMFLEKDRETNPHLLYDTFTIGGNAALNNHTIEYGSYVNELFVVVYSLEILFEEYIPIDACFKLETSTSYEMVSANTDASLFFDIVETGYLGNNQDMYWDNNEWNIYKDITIPAGEIFDLFLVTSYGEIGLILFDGDTIDDINTAIRHVNAFVDYGTPLPNNIITTSVGEGISYMTFSSQTIITANLAIFTNSPYNPANLAYDLYISHKASGGKVRVITPVAYDPYNPYQEDTPINLLYSMIGIMTVLFISKKKKV